MVLGTAFETAEPTIELVALQAHLPATAQARESDVHSELVHFPLVRAAGVRLLEPHNIAKAHRDDRYRHSILRIDGAALWRLRAQYILGRHSDRFLEVPRMKTKAILSVLGEDRVGIVAAISNALAAAGANIEDIRQTILSGVFSMTMLVTVDEDAESFEAVQARLAVVAEEIGLQVTLQREDVFRFMHRV